ncbi:uridine kinase [Capnocytophaga sp. Marseille-Q4570]|jgi:uridine kinase|uniref:Uridine kinase n=2 Tax=Capnocytophaga bilenii TaxID=2819369 RepID=A0ABS3Q0C0_9FLAO|nr:MULTISPECIES: uridine kinase [Capnocytophaga]MBO1885043.1 uridine kinase [Capnocytophaga bilenii]
MLIIGITGGTGCGKTTVVNQIVNELSAEDVTVISQDSYYKDLSHLTFEQRTQINFDHPNSIDFDLLKEHLLALKAGKTIDTPTYSFVEHNRTKETVLVKPTNVVIVEGILIFSHPDIRDLFNIKIFVHADSDERLIRRIKRDITERGRDVEEVLNRYQNTLKPMHMQFIEPMKEFADIIIPNNRYNTVAIDIIKTIVHNRVYQK